MKFRSTQRAYRRNHLAWLPIEEPEEGQHIDEVEHRLFRRTTRGRWVLYI